jgi:hypothetical protein
VSEAPVEALIAPAPKRLDHGGLSGREYALDETHGVNRAPQEHLLYKAPEPRP